MTAGIERVTPLGDSGLWARIEIVAGCIPTIRLESVAGEPSVGEDKPAADVRQVIDALANWPEAGNVNWLEHPLFPPVGTAFQRRVWRELCHLPAGECSTYGEIARAVGRPGAARAVGQAVGANPWPPLLPCHRVLAAGGHLGGYALGTGIKRQLLRLEGVDLET